MLIDKINTLEITEQDIIRLIEKINRKTETLKEEKDTSKRIKLIDEISTERNHYLTLYWASYIGYLKNIKDEKYLKSEEIMSKYEGKYNNAIYKMYEVLDSLPNKEPLLNKYGRRFFDIAHNQKILLSKETNLFQREIELRKEYRSILNSPQIEFNNEKISLSRLSKYLQDDNESIRKEAYDKRYAALLSINKDLEKVFKEILKVRSKIAKSCNFNNYTGYSYIKMNRIDYTQEDLKIFKDNIVKYFVPIREKLKTNQAKRLGEETLSYYNVSILFKDGNAKTDYELPDILNKLSEIFNDLSPEYNNLFKDMLNNGLIDLEERENKSAGGITTFLPDFKYPIFIKRYINNSANFITITHEFGHSLQLFSNKDKHLHENRWPTFDICEIHSTTMELLVSEYADKIYKDDTDKHLINHFTNIIELLIRTSAVDDFQTQIYNTTEDIDVNKIWKSIYKKYYPTNDYNLDYFKQGIMWQADINRIDDPFYGIDYALATIYALSFYRNFKLDKDKTIEDFTNFCKDGGEISFKEIATKYSLLNPFSEQDLIELSQFLEEKLNSIIE